MHLWVATMAFAAGYRCRFDPTPEQVDPVLRRFAISLARDPTAADDLVQDTLFRAWRARARFEPGTNFEAWTFTILRNVSTASAGGGRCRTRTEVIPPG